jgi:hypothetical protein
MSNQLPDSEHTGRRRVHEIVPDFKVEDVWVSRMTTWAGWLILLFPGIGHSLGALLQTAPNHAGEWFAGTGWQGDATAMTHAQATLWYTVGSFGFPFLLLGLLVLWLARRGVTPPTFLAWGMAAWTAVATAAGGPSPLLVLFVAAGLLLLAARRAARDQRPEPEPNGD